MNLIFESLVGSNLLPFGTPRRDVRNRILAGRTFSTPPGEPEIDMYKSEGLILGFDAKDLLEFIEVVPPSTCKFEGIELLSDLEGVLRSLEELGHTAPFEDESYQFGDIGVVLYCPHGLIESASTFKPGYYD